MDLDAKVIKLVDLSAVKIKDLKIRRIFIFANGERSLREIFESVKFEEEQGIEMARRLIEEGCITLDSDAIVTPTPVNHSGDSLTFTVEHIELLVEKMGAHIGPIASILVQRAVSVGQKVSQDELSGILENFASKIEDPDKREEFLADIRAYL